MARKQETYKIRSKENIIARSAISAMAAATKQQHGTVRVYRPKCQKKGASSSRAHFQLWLVATILVQSFLHREFNVEFAELGLQPIAKHTLY